MFLRLALLMMPPFVAACVAIVPVPAPGPAPGDCGAPKLQFLVGQDAAVLDDMEFSVSVRMIRPGTAVTEDFSESRLNIMIDADEIITDVTCG